MAKKKFDPALLEVMAKAAHAVAREVKKYRGEVPPSWDEDVLEERTYFMDLTENALAGKKVSGAWAGVVGSVIECVTEETK